MNPNKPKHKLSRKQLKAEINRVHTQINYMEEHDFLTGFANLALIRSKIQQLIKLHPETKMAVLLLGIDNFYLINGTLGSSVGDIVLRKISERITAYFGPNDIFLARKGGDEFIIVINNNNVYEITKSAKSLLQALAQPFMIAGHSTYITASIGISIYPQDTQQAEVLLTYADITLNQAKEAGKNTYRFFNSRLGKKAHLIQQLQKNLNHALEREELFIHYQPQIEIHNQQIITVEALLRWKNFQFGSIKPDVFIPLAETSDLILTLGDWVLHKACLECKSWPQTGTPLRISVNVSARQFQSAHIRGHTPLIKSVQSALKHAALDPELLEIEITESVIMNDNTLTRNTIKKLKDLGVRISCDDFGVGYSSFGRLKQLPIDTLKIDKSLIQDIPNNPVDVTIIRAIISIAQQLKIHTIAEGVERKEQVDALRDLGCSIIQGNYFSKPVNPDELHLILQNNGNSFNHPRP